ncbi:hypothetical protein QN277_019877 [Acacia crassicarpa]|uniref:F-box domain-containing protein n=1 Tax=Acacia crassicarpa TaxID=499986 RepID=A0AAE1JIL3_9FABA|nr:hypothetical protein QN277_019877 [Acacia crassicarpa]
MMKNKEVEAGNPFLPQEIIRDILTRLPVKSLIRFQCVCRYWRDLYRDPSFITDHLHHSNRQNPCILFQRYRSYDNEYDNHSDLYSLGSDMQVQRFQNPPLIEHLNHGEIVGSSDGLLCVQTNRLHYRHHSLLLWNPAIKEVKLVPETDFCRGFYPYVNPYGYNSIGFGFCPSLNDYKIVIPYVKNDCFEMFKVYSLRSRSWKEVKYRLDACYIHYSVTVNGVMYWSGKTEIISFDLAMEVWIVIPMPETHPSTGYDHVMVYEGKLAFVSCTHDVYHSAIHLWVREEGVGASGETWNWTKKFTSNPYPSSWLFPTTMLGNEIFCMIWYSESTNAVLFNPTTKNFKELNISKCDDEHQICNYVESLVSVGGTKSSTKFLRRRGSSSWGEYSGVRKMIKQKL